MTITPSHRRQLGLTPTEHVRGKRLAVTCELKCGNACAHPAPNASHNEYFPDIASKTFSRRTVLGAGAVGAAGTLALTVVPSAAASVIASTPQRGLPFTPIAPVAADVDKMTVPQGYEWQALIRWGDPLLPGAPDFDPNNQSPQAQELQFGYNCDYLDILPLNEGNTRAVAVVNHEYTNETIMFAPTTDPMQIEKNKKTAIAAHGFSVVELRRESEGTPWSYQRNAHLNRRITPNTPMEFSGPAAGHELLKTTEDPTGTKVRGTQNNCSGGTTPWGTVLTGEENFNQYFVANATEANSRYGIPTEPGGRAWWTVDTRFDARQAGYENEVNRFGWVVEIDPMDPTSTPVKHTSLGRFKHESATISVARDGRIVAYSGDDERFDYIYKFVSKNRMRNGKSSSARAFNKTLLSEGDLYVAKFVGDSDPARITGDGALPTDGEFDGTGQWLPLVKDGKSMVDGMSVAEVLIFTRLAADTAGATKMDRPEDIQPNPLTGKVYCALTNNSKRGAEGQTPVDEANPRTINREGHVLELTEAYNDATSETFTWNLLLVCGDPDSAGTYFGGYNGPVSPISCPDNVAFDSQGNLWISTDGQPSSLKLNDALHKVTLEGNNRGKVEQFLAVPRNAETCGPVIHDKESMVYVAVQHPGENGSWGEQNSYFPDYVSPGSLADGKWGGPRPSVVQVYKTPDKPGGGHHDWFSELLDLLFGWFKSFGLKS